MKWKIRKMTLIINFNIGLALLSDKWTFWHWTQPITFIKILVEVQTRYRERSTHNKENHSDTILGWHQLVAEWGGMRDWLVDIYHIYRFTLLPSGIFYEGYSINKNKSEMINDGNNFRWESKVWYKF